MAVVHSLAVGDPVYGVVGAATSAVSHGELPRATRPVFEIRERFGVTDMLIRDSAQGDALAESLGGYAVVLMRGHGCCT